MIDGLPVAVVQINIHYSLGMVVTRNRQKFCFTLAQSQRIFVLFRSRGTVTPQNEFFSQSRLNCLCDLTCPLRLRLFLFTSFSFIVITSFNIILSNGSLYPMTKLSFPLKCDENLICGFHKAISLLDLALCKHALTLGH